MAQTTTSNILSAHKELLEEAEKRLSKTSTPELDFEMALNAKKRALRRLNLRIEQLRKEQKKTQDRYDAQIKATEEDAERLKADIKLTKQSMKKTTSAIKRKATKKK